MKLGRKKSNGNGLPGGGNGLTQPSLNKSKNNGLVIAVLLATVALIAWVISIGKKAEETVPVVLLKQPVYKNQLITEDLIMEYDMLRGEFEKYGLDSSGKSKRLILWEDRAALFGNTSYFAAYPLQRETFLEIRDLVQSKTTNTDSVLYSFPGKEIVQLDISGSDLNSFKTFLQPGDRLNVDAIFSEKLTIEVEDGYGGTTTDEIEVFKTEPVFSGIMLADIINSDGNSILDIYSNLRERNVWDQDAIENSESFKDSTEPKSLLVALTPDEKNSYYRFLSKSNIEFKIALPQRME